MNEPDLWEEIVALRRRGEAAALATIVSTLGSTPGKMPMKMLVRGDGTIVGSVGGGCLEAEVWEHARTVMSTLRPMSAEFTLTDNDPDSGLICGGKVTVFIEPLTIPSVHVFGAGHVGRAVGNLAVRSDFRVVLYDDREDMLAPERLEEGVVARPGAFEETAADAEFGARAYAIVVTRGHHHDARVLRALARNPRPPAFLGMVGSRAKHRQLLEQLGAEGVDRSVLEAVRCPVGLPIGARTASEIAVSIVGQLIADCRGGGMGGEAERARARRRAARGAD